MLLIFMYSGAVNFGPYILLYIHFIFGSAFAATGFYVIGALVAMDQTEAVRDTAAGTRHERDVAAWIATLQAAREAGEPMCGIRP